MAINPDLEWASVGGLKSPAPQRIRNDGYTTSDGTNTGTPEYPILQWDNWFRYQVGLSINSNIGRLDSLTAADVSYEFLIEDGSNLVRNDPFDTFTARYGSASSSSGTTSLASQVNSDYNQDFARSTQYAAAEEFTRFFKDNLLFLAAKVDGDVTPKYMYGLNDIGGLDYRDEATSTKWGFPIHRYDEILGDYVLDHRVGAIDLYPNFQIENRDVLTSIFCVMQHNNILYVLFGRPEFAEPRDREQATLVKYDMENRSVLASKTLTHVFTNPTGTLEARNFLGYRTNRGKYMDISPNGNKMAIVLPSAVDNKDLSNAFHLTLVAFIVDLTDPNLAYSDISDVKDWLSSGTARDRTANFSTYDLLKWGDNDTLHLISQFPKITGINGTSSTDFPYIQHQVIDVNGLTATSVSTTNLTNDIVNSSASLTSSNIVGEVFAADINIELGEFCTRCSASGNNPIVVNRFDLNTSNLIDTNGTILPSLFNAPDIKYTMRRVNMFYDKNGKIMWAVSSAITSDSIFVGNNVSIVYLDEQFTSSTSAGTILAPNLPVRSAGLGYDSEKIDGENAFCDLIIYPTHTRYLSATKYAYPDVYSTDTKRSGGNFLNVTSNVQIFDDLSIAAVFGNVPLANSILPYMKKLKYNASTGSLTNAQYFVLAFDTTQATGGSKAISIVARGVTYNITGTGADWPTLLSDLADKLFAQDDFVNNAVVIGNQAVYVTLGYPKNNTNIMSIEQNVTLSSGDCTLGSYEISNMDSSVTEDKEAGYLYLVDYTSLSTAMSANFTDITFKQYDTYVTSIVNVQQALDALFKIVQDLEDFEPGSTFATNLDDATRYVSLNLSLTANTPLNLNHALGEKYVVATVYSDSTDQSQDATVVLVDEDNLTVEVSQTGTYNVVIVK